MPMTSEQKIEIATYVLAASALFLVLNLGLLVALLAGLLVYRLVEMGSERLAHVGVLPAVGKIILLLLFTGIAVVGVTLGSMGLVSFLTKGPESLGVLLEKMADAVAAARSHLPSEVRDILPLNV